MPGSFENYKLKEVIADEGVIRVYKAIDTETGREVITKILQTRTFKPENIPLLLERFKREVIPVSQLDHPNIQKILDYGEFREKPFLVVPLLEGNTLQQTIELQKQIPWYETLPLLIPIADALSYTHSRGVFHTDIKPANIFLTRDGNSLLVNFHINEMLGDESTLSLSYKSLGAPAYMAPELDDTHPANARSEVYALGIVCYEMITGRLPYQADSEIKMRDLHVHEPLPPPSQFVEGLPSSVEIFLIKALEKDPANRFASMDEFLRSLRQAPKIQSSTSIDETTETISTTAESFEEPEPVLLIPEENTSTGVEDLEPLITKNIEQKQIPSKGSEFSSLEPEMSSETLPEIIESSVVEPIDNNHIETETIGADERADVDEAETVKSSVVPEEEFIEMMPEALEPEDPRLKDVAQTTPESVEEKALPTDEVIGHLSEIPEFDEVPSWEDILARHNLVTPEPVLLQPDEITKPISTELESIEEPMEAANNLAGAEETETIQSQPEEIVRAVTEISEPSASLQDESDESGSNKIETKDLEQPVQTASKIVGTEVPAAEEISEPVHPEKGEDTLPPGEMETQIPPKIMGLVVPPLEEFTKPISIVEIEPEPLPVEEITIPLKVVESTPPPVEEAPKPIMDVPLEPVAQQPVEIIQTTTDIDESMPPPLEEAPKPIMDVPLEPVAQQPVETIQTTADIDESTPPPLEEDSTSIITKEFVPVVPQADDSAKLVLEIEEPEETKPQAESVVSSSDEIERSETIPMEPPDIRSVKMVAPEKQKIEPIPDQIEISPPKVPGKKSSPSRREVKVPPIKPSMPAVERKPKRPLVKKFVLNGKIKPGVILAIGISVIIILVVIVLIAVLKPGTTPGWIASENSMPDQYLGSLGNGKIFGISFTPDGKNLAIVSTTGTYFYSTHTLTLDHALSKENVLNDVTFSPDGSVYASGIYNTSIQIWDSTSATMIKTIQALPADSSNWITSLAFSSDGKTIACGSSAGIIELWDISAGAKMATLSGHSDQITNMSFSLNGSILASASKDDTIILWNTLESAVITILVQGTTNISYLTFSPDGTYLASGNRDGSIKLWNLYGGFNSNDLFGNNGEILSMAFSSDSRNLISSSSEKDNIILWNLNNNQIMQTYQDDTRQQIIYSAISPDGVNIARVALDGSISIINSANNQRIITQSGFSDRLYGIAFSPDGNTIAVASGDHTINLWDVNNQTRLPSLNGHTSIVTAIAYSPDGQTLVSSSDDGTVLVWDMKTHTVMNTIYISGINTLAFSPDGNYLAMKSFDEGLSLWDTQTWIRTRSYDNSASSFSGFSFSPDGTLLASGSNGNSVAIWNAIDGSLVSTFTGHSDFVQAIAFSPDGKTLASGGSDKSIILWNVSTGNQLGRLTDHADVVLSLEYSKQGNILASGSVDGNVILWNTADNSLVSSINTSQIAPQISISPDGSRMATSSFDGTIKLWGKAILATENPGSSDTIETGTPQTSNNNNPAEGETEPVAIPDFPLTQKPTLVKTLYKTTQNDQPVVELTFSSDSKLLAAASPSRIFFWNTDNWNAQYYYDGSDDLLSIDFSPTTSFIACNHQSDVQIVSPIVGIPLIKFPDEEGNRVETVAFSPDGNLLAGAYDDGSINVFETNTWSRLYTTHGHTNMIQTLAFSPDGNLLASGSMDDTAILWDVNGGAQIQKFTNQTGDISKVEFSDDGRFLAIASLDGSVNIWDASSWELIKTISDPQYSALSIAISPDSGILAISTDDKKITIYDTSNWEKKYTLESPSTKVISLEFSPDHIFLATGTDSGRVYMWLLK